MTPYDRGYEAGLRDVTDRLGPGDGSRADVQATGTIEDHGHTNEDESDWWLGYAHGRAHARQATTP